MLPWQNDGRKIAENFAETRCSAIPQMREETPHSLCCGLGQVATALSDTWRGGSLEK